MAESKKMNKLYFLIMQTLLERIKSVVSEMVLPKCLVGLKRSKSKK